MKLRAVQPWLVMFFLFSMVLLQIVQMLVEYQTDRKCNTAIENMQTTILAQQRVYDGLMTDYQQAAYDNISVDRIAEQQLIATESQLAALQVIASQNNLLIELAGACK